MSIASTKKVHTKGMISVSQGQCRKIAAPSATVEIKNKIQYSPFDLRFTSIEEIFAKIGERWVPVFFDPAYLKFPASGCFCIFA